MYVVREGYEGLVRGNAPPSKDRKRGDSNPTSPTSAHPRTQSPTLVATPDEVVDDRLINNLRFGDGHLLREGEGDSAEHNKGRTLKGRYIIRVGWDDVRGWFAEVSAPGLLA